MRVRAYDPTLGRFISRDPLNRTPLMGWSDQPYAYAGNNPLLNVDPSGQHFATENAAEERVVRSYARRARIRAAQCLAACRRLWVAAARWNDEKAAQKDAQGAADLLQHLGYWLTVFSGVLTALTVLVSIGIVFNPELAVAALRLAILTLSMWTVVTQVTAYQQVFAREAANDVSWFTPKHIKDYLQSENNSLTWGGGAEEGVSLLALFASAAKWGMKAYNIVKVPSLVLAALDTLAVVGLHGYTDRQMEQQMADACTPALHQAGGC